MKIAVCDDEPVIRKQVEQRIHVLYEDARVQQFKNGQALLDAEINFDIIFLDIQMEGINGMDVAGKLRQDGWRGVLVFLTAVEEYVFQAFDVGAFHYLVKPVDPAKFYEVLKRAAQQSIQLSVEEAKPFSVTVKSGGVTRKIPVDGIYYLEVFNRKITVHTTSGIIRCYGKLSDYEKNLGEDFFRCHRAFLVHLKYVSRFHAKEITLENGETLLLSKQKYAEFVKAYMNYTSKVY